MCVESCRKALARAWEGAGAWLRLCDGHRAQGGLCCNASVSANYQNTHLLNNTCIGPQVKPGDRVSIVGVYKAVSGKVSGQTSGVFRVSGLPGPAPLTPGSLMLRHSMGSMESIWMSVGCSLFGVLEGMAPNKQAEAGTPKPPQLQQEGAHQASASPRTPLLPMILFVHAQALVVGLSVQKLSKESLVKYSVDEVGEPTASTISFAGRGL